MVSELENHDPNGTRYTTSVDAVAQGVKTGISARDRCVTVNTLADEGTNAEGLRRPGHVLPLVARDGGVRERGGHTEGCVELLRLAGWGKKSNLVGVIAELVEGASQSESHELRDGVVQRGVEGWRGDIGMMRAPEAIAFGKKWGIKCCTIENLVKYVEDREGPLRKKL